MRNPLLKAGLKHFNLVSIDDFDIKFIEDRQHTEWGWQMAEQHGKWIESSILSAELARDDELRQKAREIFASLKASQEEEGYVGATAKSVRSPEKPLRGMDPYELYYVHHAMLTAYEQWGDDEALEASFGRFASKNTAVVVEPERVVTWDHTKLGGDY